MAQTQLIKRELEKIYKERAKWIGGIGPFDKRSIRKREIVLIKQQILSNLMLLEL